ncbi:Very-short-patch-repair endonuclease [Microbulbifer donghaiensis]|uniref:Very-short-patch-repair endonuclease n=1 Tax=Microbulbifer donghaiensis TaxID=494016 RepID=A0A1M5CA76_9GAMM|nr:endonuclease domain-containing protein [Microbulbifer donghaiensis]SHF51639.1 Very-short-patch-repair endonuclease [Microbulbifer donghaiensis]
MINHKRKLPSPACGGGAGGGGRLQVARARQLRSNSTEAEQRLWYFLRAHRFMGLKFKRQKPIGRYIVDFVCLQPKLIIELDGSQHATQENYDQQRDLWLQSRGFQILRFWNNQVLTEIQAVLDLIRHEVLALSPAPSPASGRGEPSLQAEE